uniref:Uncharacterized protein n=1 Tax=Arundo donax TaxID=35708 RepID=A0A0A8ZUQ3_ARUDO
MDDDAASDSGVESSGTVARGNCKRRRLDGHASLSSQTREESSKYSLSVGKLQEFLATWRTTCREYSVEQVLEFMINNYAETGTPNQRKEMKSFFTSYPGIALLNVAVLQLMMSLGKPLNNLNPTLD